MLEKETSLHNTQSDNSPCELCDGDVPCIEKPFYKKAQNYWSTIPPTIDGMLGGFSSLSHIDIQDSKHLLKQLFNSAFPPDNKRALDCGAGIGRITKHLLTNYFEKVDLVEQNPAFLEEAKNYFGSKLSDKIGEYYPLGLQDFKPKPETYDVIWMQWVMGHLADEDFVAFLKSCKIALKKNGCLVVKENITSSDCCENDEIDSSVTRPIWKLKELFEQANLLCYRQVKQLHFPKEIYSVYMFVLKPKEDHLIKTD